MENLYYDRDFVKSLRTYLREYFTDVYTSYRYRNHTSYRGTVTQKYRGVVLTAKSDSCSMRFEVWGGSELAEITFVYGKDERRKFFRSYVRIRSGEFGGFIPQEFNFINKVLKKVSMTGNNALDFILGDD